MSDVCQGMVGGGAPDAAAHTAVDTADDVASGVGEQSTAPTRGAGESPAQVGSSMPTYIAMDGSVRIQYPCPLGSVVSTPLYPLPSDSHAGRGGDHG